MIKYFFVLLAAFTLCQTSYATPKSGFGIMLGVVQHNKDFKCKENIKCSDGKAKTTGYSYGFDYQFALFDNLSFNLIYLTSNEKYDDYDENSSCENRIRHQIYGMQLLIWIEDSYFGSTYGRYTELQDCEDSPGVYNTYGVADNSAYGFVIGTKFSNLFINFHYDPFKFESTRATAHMQAYRFHIGYRFE